MERRVMSGTRVWVVGGHSNRRNYSLTARGAATLILQPVGNVTAYAGTANARTSTLDGVSRNSSIVTLSRATFAGSASRSSLQ